MTESEYFSHLEVRISRELAGMREKRLRGMWCDGLSPEQYVVSDSGSHVAGRVWIGDGQVGQSPWNFVVLLGTQRVQREQVEWAAALPAQDKTGWLFLDFERQFLKIKLSAAHLDCTASVTEL